MLEGGFQKHGRIHNVELHCTVFILFFYHARDNLNNFSDIFYCIVLKDMPQPSNSGTTGVSGFFFFFLRVFFFYLVVSRSLVMMACASSYPIFLCHVVGYSLYLLSFMKVNGGQMDLREEGEGDIEGENMEVLKTK